MAPWALALIIIICIVAALVIIIAGVLYKYIFRISQAQKEAHWKLPPGEQFQRDADRMYELIGELEALPFEELGIYARDGRFLYGRYYEGRPDRPVVFFFHGWHGHALRDNAGGHKAVRESGCPTIVVDERGHANSACHTTTFGIKERFDVLDWLEYGIKRFGPDRKMIISGVSMGAATVCMTADLPLPENVKGIIADCPYSAPKDIILRVAANMHYPGGFLWPFVRLAARLFGHFGITESSAVSAVSRGKIPLLLIHGEDDRFVPCEMSRKIYDACASEKQLETFPGAGHGISFITNEKRYTGIVVDFIDRTCG